MVEFITVGVLLVLGFLYTLLPYLALIGGICVLSVMLNRLDARLDARLDDDCDDGGGE